jgi:hypothetical protein
MSGRRTTRKTEEAIAAGATVVTYGGTKVRTKNRLSLSDVDLVLHSTFNTLTKIPLFYFSTSHRCVFEYSRVLRVKLLFLQPNPTPPTSASRL